MIEVPVVTSFTKIGPAIRRRIDEWTELDSYDLSGRTIVVTGSTSGIGFEAATTFAQLGATVVVNGRSLESAQAAAGRIAELTGSQLVRVVAGDMSEFEQVRRMADEIIAIAPDIDTLVHNAGALSAERSENSEGIETTVAAQVLGPFLLTNLLLDRLRAAQPGRVITMSSGGMYAVPLTVSKLEMSPDNYGGSEQYARAKRAQVTLNEMWAERVPTADVVFHALHPGWVDTPGVEKSLPLFRKVMGPLLRDTDEGADTLVWLVADDEATRSSGEFWLDRRPRSIYKLPSTRRADTPERRGKLWTYCVERTNRFDAAR